MFTKTWLKQLNGDRSVRRQPFEVQPLPVISGMGLVVMAIALALISSHPVPTPVVEWEGEEPDLIVPEISTELSPLPAWQVATDILPGASPLPFEPAQRHPTAPSAYDQAMAIAYRAYREQDYQTALINFRRALEHQEGDRYATEAVQNVERIIHHHRQLEAGTETHD
ncbi:MAG: hypothetical protein AB4042_12800 [Leptolyngbyaceae cyanobacterium]